MPLLFLKTALFTLLAVTANDDTTSHVQPLVLQRLNGLIVLDGYSDEPAWQEITPLPLTMFTPTFGGTASARTEIRVAYDDQFLYASGRLYEKDASTIQANSLIRDLDRGGDFFNLLLDTFNDNETLTAFVTTPAGNRLDAEITNDAEGADFFNQNWNGFWDVAVKENDEGWFAEMRIPFSNLRFQDQDGEVVFGLIAHRLIGPRNERVTFPAIPPNWSASQWKASQAQDVRLTGVYSRRPVFLTPYVLGGASRSYSASAQPHEFMRHIDFSREVGFDLKTSLTTNINLDVTVNTDFAQVEADDEQVNITRFSLFFPERRQFFQERSGVFSYRLGDVSRLFHSRTIGLSDDGQPRRIYGGVRTVGRMGDWDLGLLSMQTAAQQESRGENFGVVRVRRRLLNQYSSLGAMATTRAAGNDDYNITYGADATLRLSGNDYLNLRWAQTFDDRHSRAQVDFLDRSFASVSWERRTTVGLGLSAEARRSARFFDPAVGFNLREDIILLQGSASWGWLAGPGSRVFKFLPSLSGEIFLRDSDESFETAKIKAAWKMELRSGSAVELNVTRDYDHLQEPFQLSESAVIPVASYSFEQVGASYTASEGNGWRGSLSASAGSYYDGSRIAFTAAPAWNPSRHFELSAGYELNRIRFASRDQKLDTHLLRLRLQAAANTKISGSALVQYNSLLHRAGVNARLRYHFREGNELYVVFNEVVDTTGGQRFRQPRSLNRTLLLKYTYTFIR